VIRKPIVENMMAKGSWSFKSTGALKGISSCCIIL